MPGRTCMEGTMQGKGTLHESPPSKVSFNFTPIKAKSSQDLSQKVAPVFAPVPQSPTSTIVGKEIDGVMVRYSFHAPVVINFLSVRTSNTDCFAAILNDCFPHKTSNGLQSFMLLIALGKEKEVLTYKIINMIITASQELLATFTESTLLCGLQ